MGTRAIEFDNHRVHSFLSKHPDDELRNEHPRVEAIITGTLQSALPAQRLGSTLLEVLRGCKVFTARAAAEATGHRYARSTIAEFAALARVASTDFADYIGHSMSSVPPALHKHTVTNTRPSVYGIVSERGVWRVARSFDGAWAGHAPGPACYPTPIVHEWHDYGEAAAFVHKLETADASTFMVTWIKRGEESGSDLGLQPPHTDGPLAL